jgi:uncharacterized coiled-coil DUF342 family protein
MEQESTTQKDIDALLDYLKLSQPDPRWADSLTALVAERDALVAERDALRKECNNRFDVAKIKELVAERDALKEERNEIANDLKWLRLESRPHADRDLRERLVCAALTGLCADPNMNDLDIPCIAVDIADATLVAMRKGDTNGK